MVFGISPYGASTLKGDVIFKQYTIF